MTPARANNPRLSIRYYLWNGEQAFRITHRLHSLLLDGEVGLPEFAGTAQRIIEAIVVRQLSRAPRAEIRGSTYVFDEEGKVDLSAQVNAVQGLFGPSVTGNSVDLRGVLAQRRWTGTHRWRPPPAALNQVLPDVLPRPKPKTAENMVGTQ